MALTDRQYNDLAQAAHEARRLGQKFAKVDADALLDLLEEYRAFYQSHHGLARRLMGLGVENPYVVRSGDAAERGAISTVSVSG